jgi:hypothetical protein
MRFLANLVTILLLAGTSVYGQLIIADDSNVTGNGTGFALDTGVNSGINPPTTRLTGSAAADLRYIQTATGKADTAFRIDNNKIAVQRSPNSGRFTLSADGSSAFDLASVLGTPWATPANPVVYDITMSMANHLGGTVRFAFALATEENNANFWDFGIQLYRANSADNFYQVGKRIDVASYTLATDSSGSAGDLNAPMTTTAAGTYGDEIDFLIRVTDAGEESAAYNSRVQVSMDGGSSWFYDTQTDTDLPDGFRLDGPARYLSWDQAGANAGAALVTYDNFSVTIITAAVPEPSTLALGILAGVVALIWRRR